MKKPKLQTEFQQGRGYTKHDWDSVEFPELSDAELGELKPAKDILPEGFLRGIDALRRSRGRPPVESPRKLITLRLDQDVIDTFKAQGKGWQTRINETLRKAAGI